MSDKAAQQDLSHPPNKNLTLPNVAPMLEERLGEAQRGNLRLITDALSDQKVDPWLVGGSVRDLLMDRTPADLDVALVGGTTDTPSDLSKALGAELVAHSQFGTAKLKIGDDVIDLAMARRESYAYPGALPAVAGGSIHDDLARRDFAFNAMAISLSHDSWGDLLDPFEGKRDLRSGVVRVLHPESFIDDATRILRAVRYAGRLGLTLEPGTRDLLTRDLSYLETIKGDRIRHELERMFQEENVAPILQLAQHLGVLSAIYPPLRLEGEVLHRLVQARITEGSERTAVFLSSLAYSVPEPQLSGLITRLNMGTRWSRIVRDTAAVREAIDELRSSGVKASQVHRLLHRYDEAAIKGCALATEDRHAAGYLALYLTELRVVETVLRGDDLIRMGVTEGPGVGRLLEHLLTAKLDGLLATGEDERRYIARQLRKGPD